MSKFKGISIIMGSNISTISGIAFFSEQHLELRKHITSISAHPVFLILKFNSSGKFIDPDFPFGKPSNILDLNILPTLAEIESSTFYHFRRGTKFNQENLL
jgi:hypothetical protein